MVDIPTNADIFQSGGGYQTGNLGSPALDTGLTSQQSADTYGTPQVQNRLQTIETSWENISLQSIL